MYSFFGEREKEQLGVPCLWELEKILKPEGEAETAGPEVNTKAKGEGGSSSGMPTVERWGVTWVRHVRGKREPEREDFYWRANTLS